MAEINPTRIMQKSIDQDVSADGVPIQQSAAPTSSQTRPTTNTISSMKELPLTEDSPKAGDIKPVEEPSTTQDTTAPAEETTTTPDEPSLNYNDFLKAGNNEKFIPEEKKDEVQTNKTTEEELQTGLPQEQKNEQVTTAPLTKQQRADKIAQDKKTRDITGIPEELAPHFKEDMSRPAFEKIAPIVKEYPVLKQQVTELTQKLEQAKKGGLPDNYYEHPQAFVLSPEFNQASARANIAQQIVNHWQQQFAEVRGGAAEYTNIGFDQNGNLVETGKVKADPGAEAQLIGIINKTQMQAISEQAKLESLAITHKDKHAQAMNWLQNYENEKVGVFNTEKGKPFLPQVQQILKSFPPAFQNNPLAMSVAKRDLVIFQLANIIKGLEQGKGNGAAQPNTQQPVRTPQNRVQQTRRLAGPTNGDVGADVATNGNGNSNVTIEAFEAAKNGY